MAQYVKYVCATCRRRLLNHNLCRNYSQIYMSSNGTKKFLTENFFVIGHVAFSWVYNERMRSVCCKKSDWSDERFVVIFLAFVLTPSSGLSCTDDFFVSLSLELGWLSSMRCDVVMCTPSSSRSFISTRVWLSYKAKWPYRIQIIDEFSLIIIDDMTSEWERKRDEDISINHMVGFFCNAVRKKFLLFIFLLML